MTYAFRNWSGSVSFEAARHSEPTSEEAVAAAVATARADGTHLRAVGSGHSSTALVSTSGTLMSIDALTGVHHHDSGARRASLWAGTTIEQAGRELERYGLMMENLGDVNYQTLAGALSTGTHGTGIEFGNLSSTLMGGRLVIGTGEVMPFGVDAGDDADDAMVRAIQVSLGALGVLTSVTLQVVPAVQLHRRNWMTGIDWVIDHFDELVADNRHMDVYWYPRSDEAQVRTLNEPGHEPHLTPPDGYLKTDETGPAWQIIPHDRHLKFEEMEYMLPYENGVEVFHDVRARIKAKHRRHVGWRVLLRTIAADDAMLSNCHGRPTMTIALLHNNQLPYERYFDDMEPIMRAGDGRPHWGKKHTVGAADLAGMYPDWDEFHRIRGRLDPQGVFMNDHLHQLFGSAGEHP